MNQGPPALCSGRLAESVSGRRRLRLSGLVLLCIGCCSLRAQGPQSVLVVVNDNSSLSRSIGEYYARRRGIPLSNECHIRTTTQQDIARPEYDREIARPIAAYLKKRHLEDRILYIVTTEGVPLRIPGSDGPAGTQAAVDSELTLLYADMKSGVFHAVAGALPNPFFGRKETPFTHPRFPIYLVTRLAAYDFEEVKAMIDRSMHAANQGKFVIDLSTGDQQGDSWLRQAASLLPGNRVILDDSTKVLYDEKDVIGYASWGSNDHNRHRRFLGNQWLPGAIATEFVSTDGRTFSQPPKDWNSSANWKSPKLWFFGSPQSMTADFLEEGATGASGHVYEPYLALTPRPNLLLPAYYSGRNLAESYYLSIPGLSWQNIVVGDPLCSLGKP
jgi:uncharacterized protein (TIGR03790 family)